MDGMLEADFLLPGQYFRVMGSIFNDGVHQYGNDFLNDEDFTGSVWALAIPEAVINLAQEIQSWRETNGAKMMSPYSSENLSSTGYSRQKDSADSLKKSTWQYVFSSRLNEWRKI